MSAADTFVPLRPAELVDLGWPEKKFRKGERMGRKMDAVSQEGSRYGSSSRWYGTGEATMQPLTCVRELRKSVERAPRPSEAIRRYHQAFPDLHLDVEELIVAGDTVVLRMRFPWD